MATLVNMVEEVLDFIKKEYHHRVYICDVCEFNKGNSCEICGCFICAKAAIPTAKCPEGKW
jgi:hypothetical protein